VLEIVPLDVPVEELVAELVEFTVDVPVELLWVLVVD